MIEGSTSVFGSTINTPSLDLVPLVFVMTKMDQCRLDAPRIEKICSFMAVSRELGIKCLLLTQHFSCQRAVSA